VATGNYGGGGVDVTAVEWDSEKADIYRELFPKDTVIETDAHEYLREHMDEYDFIWSSPPCPTHSRLQDMNRGKENTTVPYPDMNLWQEIIHLQKWCEADWVVENVITHYDPIIDPYERGKHYFWSNYYIPEFDFDGLKVEIRGPSNGRLENARERTGFDLSKFDVTQNGELKMLNNAVTPQLGKHVFESRGKQTTLI